MEGHLYVCVRIDCVLRLAFLLSSSKTNHFYYVLINLEATYFNHGNDFVEHSNRSLIAI